MSNRETFPIAMQWYDNMVEQGEEVAMPNDSDIVAIRKEEILAQRTSSPLDEVNILPEAEFIVNFRSTVERIVRYGR